MIRKIINLFKREMTEEEKREYYKGCCPWALDMSGVPMKYWCSDEKYLKMKDSK